MKISEEDFNGLLGIVLGLIALIGFYFASYLIVEFFNSYLGEVIWKLMMSSLIIFITGFYALSVIPGPYLGSIFNFSLKKIKVKILRIQIESFTSSPLRTILSFFLFGFMIYVIWDLIYWMLTGFEITWTNDIYSPESDYEHRIHRRR